MNLGHLLCRTGWHAPLAHGRWNGGYCFTTCRRCGRDMVRSAFGEWHVPKGFRVVWEPRATSHPPPASNGHDPAGPLNGKEPPAPNGRSRSRPPPLPSPFDFDDFG